MRSIFNGNENDNRSRLRSVPNFGLAGAVNPATARLCALVRRCWPAQKSVLRPADFAWHQIDPPLYRSLTLVDGRRSRQTGRLWRRRTAAGHWEYRQDAETFDEFLDRQW